MSNGNRFNESPNHFMVLDAIARDMKKVSSIAKVTKLSKDEVELIINDLKSQRLITVEVKKGFFGNKKTEIFIAETGTRILNSKKEELTYKSQKLQQLYQTGDRAQMQSYMNDNRMWMPMMLFSGLINMMMFASMMSFMGMAMNPGESAQTEGQVDQSGVGGESTGTEDSGAAADTSDTGGFSDMGGGMDTGGFDSF
jgi:hypothetical protein